MRRLLVILLLLLVPATNATAARPTHRGHVRRHHSHWCQRHHCYWHRFQVSKKHRNGPLAHATPAPQPRALPPVATPYSVAPAALEPGRVKYRLDAKSYFDPFRSDTTFLTAHIARVLGYPAASDGMAKVVPTLGYHDAWTTWGASGATHVAEYVAWAQRDAAHGYAGQFMDDVNFAGGHIAGTREQYATLIAAVRQAIGQSGVLEINAQYSNLWPLMKSGEPIVARALSYVNMVDKEFGVAEAAAGINTPARYGEFLAYVDALHAKGIHIDLTSSKPGDYYSLATYLLLNDGGDYIGAKVTPETWWAGFETNLGLATGPRERLSTGVYHRQFAHGQVYVNPPGGTTVVVAGQSLPAAQGLVLPG